MNNFEYFVKIWNKKNKAHIQLLMLHFEYCCQRVQYLQRGCGSKPVLFLIMSSENIEWQTHYSNTEQQSDFCWKASQLFTSSHQSSCSSSKINNHHSFKMGVFRIPPNMKYGHHLHSNVDLWPFEHKTPSLLHPIRHLCESHSELWQPNSIRFILSDVWAKLEEVPSWHSWDVVFTGTGWTDASGHRRWGRIISMYHKTLGTSSISLIRWPDVPKNKGKSRIMSSCEEILFCFSKTTWLVPA